MYTFYFETFQDAYDWALKYAGPDYKIIHSEDDCYIVMFP